MIFAIIILTIVIIFSVELIDQKFLSWINTSDLDSGVSKKQQWNYFGNQLMDSSYMMSQEKNGIFSLLGVCTVQCACTDVE